MFKGIFTALITPFKNGKVDEESFSRLIEWQIEQGVHGLVPCGTTGESPTLSYDEHNRVISLCVEKAKGKALVIAGTGANNTAEAIMFTKHAKEVGADTALVVSPYYNKPTPEGIYQHFKAICDAVDIPIMVYNIPGRSAIDITDDIMVRLAELPNIMGIKDATGDLARISTLRARIKKPFVYFSGEDMTAISYNAQGGDGCISVTANIAPKLCSEMHNAWFNGDSQKALEIHEKLVPLHSAMFCESSPAPAKYAASLLGLCSSEVRLPLVEPTDASKERVKVEMSKLGLI